MVLGTASQAVQGFTGAMTYGSVQAQMLSVSGFAISEEL